MFSTTSELTIQSATDCCKRRAVQHENQVGGTAQSRRTCCWWKQRVVPRPNHKQHTFCQGPIGFPKTHIISEVCIWLESQRASHHKDSSSRQVTQIGGAARSRQSTFGARAAKASPRGESYCRRRDPPGVLSAKWPGGARPPKAVCVFPSALRWIRHDPNSQAVGHVGQLDRLHLPKTPADLHRQRFEFAPNSLSRKNLVLSLACDFGWFARGTQGLGAACLLNFSSWLATMRRREAHFNLKSPEFLILARKHTLPAQKLMRNFFTTFRWNFKRRPCCMEFLRESARNTVRWTPS